MSPRPYRAGQRKVAAEQTRAKILEAARELLTGEKGPAALSMEAVARTANVARMTVYYQFESKTGLLEALFDDLAMKGGMMQMREAFMRAPAEEALGELTRIFTRFYASARLALRRLRGLAIMDSDLEGALTARGERRRNGIRVIVARLLEERAITPPEAELEELTKLIFMLTSFETYDALAGPEGDAATEEVSGQIRDLVLALLTHRLESGRSSR